MIRTCVYDVIGDISISHHLPIIPTLSSRSFSPHVHSAIPRSMVLTCLQGRVAKDV